MYQRWNKTETNEEIPIASNNLRKNQIPYSKSVLMDLIWLVCKCMYNCITHNTKDVHWLSPRSLRTLWCGCSFEHCRPHYSFDTALQQNGNRQHITAEHCIYFTTTEYHRHLSTTVHHRDYTTTKRKQSLLQNITDN